MEVYTQHYTGIVLIAFENRSLTIVIITPTTILHVSHVVEIKVYTLCIVHIYICTLASKIDYDENVLFGIPRCIQRVKNMFVNILSVGTN